MSNTFRIALATPPYPRSIDDGLKHVDRMAREASEKKAQIICFPESYIPGYRFADAPPIPHDPNALHAALEHARSIARQYRIAIVLPMDWDQDGAIQNVAMVISSNGDVLGYQTKNQVDPSEDQIYVPGTERRLFEVDGVKFGVVICHEGFRYPELVRWAAKRGAQIVFHPHCTGDNHSTRKLKEWRHRDNPYYESAMMCRALENTIYFAGVNYALSAQDSATTVVGPTGDYVAHLPYGEEGVLINELDLTRATRLLASRCKV